MLATWRDDLMRYAERRLPALTRYRQAETLPIRLHARRVYILPTRFGLVFAVLLVAMLIGALNFNNNPALLLALLVAATTMISFHHNVGQLNRIELRGVGAEPVHAGQPIRLRLNFHAGAGAERPSLVLDQNALNTRFSLAPDRDGEAVLDVPTARRGRMPVGRLRLWTDYPFGITWAWSVLHPELQVLVYPAPETNAPPLPVGDPREQGSRLRFPGDDWHGLREHRAGDPPKHIAWKPSARQERLLVKEFADPQSRALLLDWHDLPLDREARISRLTRWVIEARDRQLSFRLRLPEIDLGPGQGPAFAAQCLRELALLP
jgi:uncharacterized protein (DUF58 family)